MGTELSEDDAAALSAIDWHIPDIPSPAESPKSDTELEDKVSSDPNAPSQPMQKRRRVTRACDECRRKKIKCDGKQPCTHCSVYSYGNVHIVLILYSSPIVPCPRQWGVESSTTDF